MDLVEFYLNFHSLYRVRLDSLDLNVKVDPNRSWTAIAQNFAFDSPIGIMNKGVPIF